MNMLSPVYFRHAIMQHNVRDNVKWEFNAGERWIGLVNRGPTYVELRKWFATTYAARNSLSQFVTVLRSCHWSASTEGLQ